MISTSVPTPILRDYQKQVVSDLYAKIRAGFKRILLFAPTGAGKTLISSQVIADAMSKGRKSLFLVHRDILISQTAKKLESFNVDCGFIKSGWAEDRNALVQLGSIQTMVKRQWWKEDFSAQVILIDYVIFFINILQQQQQRLLPFLWKVQC